MAELKTKATAQPVEDFLAQIADETKQSDCRTIYQLMEEVTGQKAKMWGPAIIGVGHYVYQYDSGRTNDWFMMGFSPRKQNISLYIMGCKAEVKSALLAQLGKHKTAKSCIYINKLSDINMDTFKKLCEESYNNLKEG